MKNLRNQFARSLGSQLYDLLVQIYANFTPPDARSPEFLELLHGLYVLEYENDDLLCGTAAPHNNFSPY